MSGVAALLLTALALPTLLARTRGGRAPRPGPQLAALAPLAVLPAIAAAFIAVAAAWWLAVLLAFPAAVLLAWQLPPRRPRRYRAGPGSGPVAPVTFRVFSVNARGGWADPGAVLRTVRRHDVDVLAVQELTEPMLGRLMEVGLGEVLPSARLDPRPGSAGTGLWARRRLDPLPPLPGLAAVAPRARVDLGGRRSVTFAVVHTQAPTKGCAVQWQRELALLGPGLTGAREPQIVAGDFNASRDHRLFRDLLAAGFLDCADVAQRRPWPGFTWPTTLDTRINLEPGGLRAWLRARRTPPVMRLDHVLVSRTGAAVREVRTIRIPGTDHRGVLAVLDLPLGRGGPEA